MKLKNLKKNWYIIKIKTGLESTIKYKINSLFKKEKKINKIFIPYIKSNGKKKKNILPGYLIINLNLNNILLYKIKKIKGVNYFLNERRNKLPISLDFKEIINFIKSFLKIKKEKKKIVKKNINLKLGEDYKIIEGLFNGLNGIITNIYEKYFIVTIYIMGRKIPVKINLNKNENNKKNT
ncbi:MAG: hypothetical protein NHG13_00255 [Candidatus Shikimatogenerans bostrichidophilus]|nr:MAG: hypothetical protein NHG13_00255 [Candidatus Shikimatogenerans bostrichidophilus]